MSLRGTRGIAYILGIAINLGGCADGDGNRGDLANLQSVAGLSTQGVSSEALSKNTLLVLGSGRFVMKGVATDDAGPAGLKGRTCPVALQRDPRAPGEGMLLWVRRQCFDPTRLEKIEIRVMGGLESNEARETLVIPFATLFTFRFAHKVREVAKSLPRQVLDEVFNQMAYRYPSGMQELCVKTETSAACKEIAQITRLRVALPSGSGGGLSQPSLQKFNAILPGLPAEGEKLTRDRLWSRLFDEENTLLQKVEMARMQDLLQHCDLNPVASVICPYGSLLRPVLPASEGGREGDSADSLALAEKTYEWQSQLVLQTWQSDLSRGPLSPDAVKWLLLTSSR